jgi:uncharacterized protein YlxP (DUF503 family)
MNLQSLAEPEASDAWRVVVAGVATVEGDRLRLVELASSL